MRAFLVFGWAVLCAVAFFVAASVRFAEAAPSSCGLPGTVGRAVKEIGNGPAACAMNTCRWVGTSAVKVVPCTSGPSCAFIPPYIEAWRAEWGSWASLPACPSWTNTAVWK